MVLDACLASKSEIGKLWANTARRGLDSIKFERRDFKPSPIGTPDYVAVTLSCPVCM